MVRSSAQGVLVLPTSNQFPGCRMSSKYRPHDGTSFIRFRGPPEPLQILISHVTLEVGTRAVSASSRGFHVLDPKDSRLWAQGQSGGIARSARRALAPGQHTPSFASTWLRAPLPSGLHPNFIVSHNARADSARRSHVFMHFWPSTEPRLLMRRTRKSKRVYKC